MTNPTQGDATRWRGFSHEDLYKMLHDGPGATASAEPSRRWSEIASTLTEIGQDLKKALDLTGSAWTGPAAGAAYSRLSTTVAWASAAGTSASAMRTSVEDQAGHIAKARAEMPQPGGAPAAAPDPTVAPAVQVLQTQTDAEPAEAAASSAEEKAVEVMTTYENSTNTTTGALPTFSRPEPLVPSNGLHEGRGGGLLGGLTSVAGLLGGGRRDDDDRRYDNRDNNRGGRGGDSRGTWGASAEYDEGRRGRNPMPGPGRMTGASNDPFLFSGSGNGGGRVEENTPRRGNVVNANPNSSGSGSSVPGGGSKAGMGMPAHELQQAQQAAAASQAAAGTHPGAGAPYAPTAGAPMGAQEKLAMRRFGMDAIGSSQWFADNEEPVPGQAPKRRFDLREDSDEEETVTESVSIMDEEHKLPPNVIGEGGR